MFTLIPPLQRSQLLLSLLAALLLLTTVNPAWGLGMGEMTFQSSLGEPLRARIELLAKDANAYGEDNLRVRQIGTREAGELGIEIVETYYGIHYQPMLVDDRLYIDVTTAKPVNEPYIDLLIEVRWPKGSVYRQYTILLDPPTAPQLKAARSGQSLPLAPTSSPVRATAGVAEVAAIPGGGDYRVQSGDTLYAIARRTESRDGESVAAMMDWIYQNNPQAFVGGDRNRLMAGVRLLLPGRAAFAARAEKASTQLEQPVATVPVAPAAERPPVEKPLLSLEEGTTLSEERLISQSASPEEIRAHINATRENQAQLDRENQQLRQQLALLEASNYVENLEKLIALKEQQILALKEEQAQQVQPDPDTSGSNVAPAPVPQDRPSLVPVQADTNGLAGTKAGWWVFYGLVIAALVGFLVYFMGKRKGPAEFTELVPATLAPAEEEAMLRELDDLANQYRASSRDVADDAEAEEVAVPDYVGQVTAGKVKSMPGRDRRPDEEVMRDIERRVQGYTPKDSNRVMSVPEQHDEVDQVIAEALNFITDGKFDTAEAMLLEADFEARGKDGRLTDAMEYLNYCRESKGSRNAS